LSRGCKKPKAEPLMSHVLRLLVEPVKSILDWSRVRTSRCCHSRRNVTIKLPYCSEGGHSFVHVDAGDAGAAGGCFILAVRST
jgi:hypothetical protein